MEKYKSGQRAPHSGQFELVGSRGDKTGDIISLSKGETFPPTPKSGQSWSSKSKN